MLALNRPFGLLLLGLGVIAGAVGFELERWRSSMGHALPARASVSIDSSVRPAGMVWVPGGEFLMGSTGKLAAPNEQPIHKVRVRGFWMGRTDVTNAEFATFVAATGYVTTAERSPELQTIRAQLPPGAATPAAEALLPGGMVFAGTREPVELSDYSRWWRFIPGADWNHPLGPGSSIAGKQDHPVVQVSYEDALAYAAWRGGRLPTEAEWEYAARGGLAQSTYSWGDEWAPGGKRMANVWQGSSEPFPVTAGRIETHGTEAVCTFPVNGFDLCDMTGNVWQWIADWYRSDAYRLSRGDSVSVDPKGPDAAYDADNLDVPDAPRRVIRGGSYLCSSSYCRGYRPSARQGSDPYTSTSHIGFRLVSDRAPPVGH